MFEIPVNNGQKMQISHDEKSERVIIRTVDSKGELVSGQAIPDGDFVMLINLNAFYMQNDIKSAFINPHGSIEAREMGV